MLVILRDLIDQKSDQLTPEEKAEFEGIFDLSSVSDSVTHFTDTPDAIYAKREAVANAILKLLAK